MSPYWGLRDYGTATWIGGDPACDHIKADAVLSGSSTLGVPAGGGARRIAEGNATVVHKEVFRSACGKCGATRVDSQLGLERTPEEYVAALVGVFREVRRVLRDDGTVWLNLGDSYASGEIGRHDGIERANGGPGFGATRRDTPRQSRRPDTGLKPKDLVGIPWRVAFALQADGWYLRSDIVWSKPNPMPESVTDRPTKSHEYVFLLAKSPRYFFDADAVREANTPETVRTSKYRLGPVKVDASRNDAATLDRFANPAGRNIRSVWTVATAPYPGSHFATFPPKLVEPMILAGCPSGGVVLDPFAGTGTVGMVAAKHSRRAVLVDLNPDYLAQCLARNAQTPLGLPA